MKHREHLHTIPMQIEYAKMNHFDERRHKTYCIWYCDDGSCSALLSPCISSSHCKYYRDARDANIQNNLPKRFRNLQEFREEHGTPLRSAPPFATTKAPVIGKSWEEKNADDIQKYFASATLSNEPSTRELIRFKKENEKRKPKNRIPLSLIAKKAPQPALKQKKQVRSDSRQIKKNLEHQSPYFYLLGKKVMHKKLGEGVICEVLHDRIRIKLHTSEVIEISNSEMFGGLLSIKI